MWTLSQGFILFTQKTKTRKVRRVEIFPDLVPVLMRRIDLAERTTDTLFPAAWTSDRVSMDFRRAAKRADLVGFRFHDLRQHADSPIMPILCRRQRLGGDRAVSGVGMSTGN